jgi:predicted neuraminidase
MFFKRSDDLGSSWTDLEILTSRRRILGKNKPICIDPCTWILPVEYEGIGDVAFMRSVNGGKSWKIIDRPGLGAYLDQPTVVQLRDGSLLAYMRSWEGYIFETRSNDKGLTWTEPIPTILPNPNSGIDMTALHSGELALVYNPTALGSGGNLTVDHSSSDQQENAGVAALFDHDDLQNAWDYELRKMLHKAEGGIEFHESGVLAWGPRTPLYLAISYDEGKSWNTTHVLENSEGEFSYPAIIQASDGSIHILYTYNRTHIKYVRIEKSEIKNLKQLLSPRQE